LLLLAACQKVYWVGFTDVEITFVVIDADTGQPIPGATVQVHSEGGFCEDQEVKDFRLTTDPEGVAARRCRECMSFGRANPLLPYRNTFGVHLPLWEFGVSAPGYASSGKAWVGDYGPARRRKADAALAINVPLHRLPAREQGDPAQLRGDAAPLRSSVAATGTSTGREAGRDPVGARRLDARQGVDSCGPGWA
jgi:hypothetical protein